MVTRKSKSSAASRPPIWERLGFSTRNQYRNAQAAKITNPATGKPYTSYRQMRDATAKAQGRERDYAGERERSDIRARRQGYQSARDRQRINRTRRDELAESKTITLAKWGITESTLNRYRTANKKYSAQYTGGYTTANMYRLDIDTDIRNFSDRRVGYIVSYYHAMVDPKHNYASLYEGKRRRKRFGYNASNVWQKRYLVDYGSMMSQREFESRYGNFYN